MWDEASQQGIPLHVPDYGGYALTDGESVSLIPSLVHFGENGTRWVGQQVLQRNLQNHPATFRWMKRYISSRSPIRRKVRGEQISHTDAGQAFLSSVLAFAQQETRTEAEEIALTIPVEAYEHYDAWITSVAENAGLPRVRLIDEPSAAALGYGAHIQPGDVYLIFDFGGGTLDVSVVLIEEESNQQNQVGRRCRVLGKAGADIGGSVIDQWIFQHVLTQNNRLDVDEDVRLVSQMLLNECERAKIQLSQREETDITVVNPETGAVLGLHLTRTKLEDLLDKHEMLTQLDRAVRSALNGARERGYKDEDVKAVLLVGGSSQIPVVQRTLQRIFGRDRVMSDRPMDAVARGAAAFVAGVDFFDHIQHDYAIRFLNRQKGDYDYRTLVPRGTPYPTQEPVARLTIKASYDGQEQLGLAIFEIGRRTFNRESSGMELVFDPTGAARLADVAHEEEERRTHFWMNEGSPTFLLADPPGKAGERRFDVSFSIDANKRLLITCRDLRTNQLTHRDYPVVKLS